MWQLALRALPLIARSGIVKEGLKQGAVMGIAGRTANMMQGKNKDGEQGGQSRENFNNWFPGQM